MHISLWERYLDIVFLECIPDGNAYGTFDIGDAVFGIADPDAQFHVDGIIAEIFQLANRFGTFENPWYILGGLHNEAHHFVYI